MNEPIVECVPNFSEGRDAALIKAITDRIETVSGVRLLDVDPGPDTNRTVVTFVGPPAAVEEAAFRGIARASELIDMSRHTGAHPRMGATDVCPFVPVSGVTMADCVEMARRVGKRIGEELAIPVYLYEEAASRPERRNLASVRKGEYEGLAEKLRRPGVGPRLRPGRHERPLRRHRRRRPRVPRRLEHRPQYPRQEPGDRHRLRAPGNRPERPGGRRRPLQERRRDPQALSGQVPLRQLRVRRHRAAGSSSPTPLPPTATTSRRSPAPTASTRRSSTGRA